MKRIVVYWITKDRKRKEEVKAELGITSVSVNGESEYKGEIDKLTPYVEEGLIKIRVKEYEEVRRKEIRIETNSQLYNVARSRKKKRMRTEA